ncbi:MAG: metalloregulator ArsR/SmtB family transcription factor [Oscillospiraceae bacterium]|nr:metalloregulator ArsR/SmtB family transcription factor [Oscillospiraceae bacterium]
MADAHLPHHHTDHKNSLFLTQALSNVKEFGVVAEVFGQLSDPTRLRIFWMLCHCEECVINIAALMDMSSPAISHHLRSLRDTGLIVSRREGKEVFYRASDSEVAQLLHHMIEQTMSITCPEEAILLSDCRADQAALIHEVHEYLLQHLDEKITIDALSRQFHMNATTLKSVFKSVYGDSLASHIKEHRMERAAELLTGTGLSIAEIAAQVGYDSQSKFASAFKGQYGVLPKEYRKSRPDSAV